MNIIKLFIEINSKRQKQSIQFLVIESFKKTAFNHSSYIFQSQNKWSSQKTNLSSLYSPKDLIAYQNVATINYFIFDSNQSNYSNLRRKTFDLLIVSDIDNIDYSVNRVISDIKEKMRGFKLLVLKENNVFLYPYNTSQDDIYDPSRIIKAGFKKKQILNKWEIWRIAILSFITCILVALHLFGNLENEYISVIVSLYCSGMVFLLTEIFLKLGPILDRKISISVEDLTDFIRENPALPFSDGEENNIDTPEEIS